MSLVVSFGVAVNSNVLQLGLVCVSDRLRLGFGVRARVVGA